MRYNGAIMNDLSYFATCAKNIEGLLREELQALGAAALKETVSGVYFQGDIELGYRICLWSRLANHILLQLTQFEAVDDQALYEGLQKIDWAEHLAVEGTFCIEVTGQHATLLNSMFIAQRAKDAIVDQFRERTGKECSGRTRRGCGSSSWHPGP